MAVRLMYIGKQEFPGYPPMRLWNILCEGHPFDRSTRSEEGLRELGIIK
jgi:hypothetical protein